MTISPLLRPGPTFDTRHYPNNTDIKYSSSDKCCVRRYKLFSPFFYIKVFFFTGVPCHRQIKMRRDVWVLKSASIFHFLPNKKTILNLFKMQRDSICFPPQQARRSTDYKLRFEHRHLCEPRWMLKLFCKLCTRMLLSSLSIPTSSSYGKTHPFQCWQYYQCGWMYKSMWRSWFHACGTQVGLS